MSSHLHLHIGAHKTASTHFQCMLKMIDRRSIPDTLIPHWPSLRKEITHGNRFLISEFKPDIRSYLNNLLSSGFTNVVISEENLIGEAKDFIDGDSLYINSIQRLKAFSDLLPDSQRITIWFFIRSLDTFLPSVYCEYLRHWRYRNFSSLLNGKYLQSWLPVVNTFKSVFPQAHLNIVDYHQYHKVCPKILTDMTGVLQNDLSAQLKVIRPRLSSFSVRTASFLPNYIPPYLRHKAVDFVSNISHLTGLSQTFSPFGPVMVEQLRDAYNRDILSLRNLQTVSLFE